MEISTLYYIGLALVTFYLITGLDDFIWDIIALWKRRKMEDDVLDFNLLDSTSPKLIAVVIAAWHEDNVLLDVVENIVASQQYPKSMYHIFLGVYPNDDATVFIAKQLAKNHFNVHCVENYKEGPTSKAQNINYVISQIKDYEAKLGWRFAAINVHDSEDLVHPYELKVTNYLLDTYPAMQFPVFPLLKKPTFKNYFSNITTNTYADEFAENHYITMVNRRNTGAFVPSAGTGFSLSRETIDTLGYYVLPENSLTEDYRLSLTLYENGLQMYYVLEQIERLGANGKVEREFVATRSMFPNTFKTAVRQKTRWILGITMQSLKFKDIFNEKLTFAGKYSLYRDQKAKLGNLLSMVGYPVLIYFIASLFIELTPIYPKYSLSWYLCLVVTIMMIERQIFRGVALKAVYGWRSAFFGCLFPPLVPFRIVWGNIINLVATVRAYIQYGNGRAKPATPPLEKPEDLPEINETPNEIPAEIEAMTDVVASDETEEREEEKIDFAWSKTEHSFLPKSVLVRFHRKYGDVLVAKNFISVDDLKKNLEEKEKEGSTLFIGEYLLQKKLITESQFIDVLTSIKNIPFVTRDSLKYYNLIKFRSDFNQEFLVKNNVLPILKTKNGYVFAYGSSAPLNIQSQLRKLYKLDVQAVLATDSTIEYGIRKIYRNKNSKKTAEINQMKNIYENYLNDDKITVEQIVILRNYLVKDENECNDVACKMGLCQ